MDLNDQITVNQEETPKLELLNESLGYLNETRKWTGFLAILGFIFTGLMVIMGFSIGTIFSKFGNDQIPTPFPSYLFGIIYLFFGLIYFFPILYLYRFSAAAKRGLNTTSSNELNNAFKNLKAHFRYVGIMMIIVLAIYAVGLIFLMIGGLESMMM